MKKPKRLAKPKAPTQRIYMEVLQNGTTLATTERKLKEDGSICLSASGGDLKIPFYPLSADVEIINIKDGAASLRLNLQSDGFVASRTNFRIIRAHRKENLEPVKLKDGDYGAVNFFGLKILFRVSSKDPINKANEAAAEKIRKTYSGGTDNFFHSTPSGNMAKIAAVFLATVLIGAFVGGFLSRPVMMSDRESLPPVYKLPFISAEHIKILPEVLQGKLVRSNMLNQTTRYYQELTGVLGGFDTVHKLLSDETHELYKSIYEQHRAKLEKLDEDQAKRDKANLAAVGSALPILPSVVGESFDREAERIRNKVALHNKIHLYNLENRRLFTKRYMKEKEESYLFQDYKTKKARNPKDKKELQESLAKIKPFALMSDEEAMYFEAEQLSQSAKNARLRLDRGEYSGDSDSAKELVMDTPFAAATFRAPADWRKGDDKFSQIIASEYGVVRKAPIKEPLIGQLDPKLVERTINQRKFELQLCYDVALRRNQGIAGTMAWQWRLDSRGVLSDLTLQTSDIRDDRMIDCVRERIARWKFPRPSRGSVEIQYPFTFRKARG